MINTIRILLAVCFYSICVISFAQAQQASDTAVAQPQAELASDDPTASKPIAVFHNNLSDDERKVIIERKKARLEAEKQFLKKKKERKRAELAKEKERKRLHDEEAKKIKELEKKRKKIMKDLKKHQKDSRRKHKKR